MSIEPKIFKAYDIRGVFPTEVNAETAYQIGRAFAVYTQAAKVVVGRDVRLSGPELFQALARGITEQGADVLDVGLVSTDMFYYACGSMGLPGITVTASHNPKEYNGFKLVRQMPELVSGEKIRVLVLAGNFPESSKKGVITPLEIKDGYRDKVLSLVDIKKLKPKKIVLDPANGLGGSAWDIVKEGLPAETMPLFYEPDGNFPNHGGDPLKEENRVDLQKKVSEVKADLGFAIDTDGDRLFAIDGTGAYLPSDFLGALLAQYLIKRHNGGTIVHDAIMGWAVRDLVAASGGKTFTSRVGHVFMKAEMEKQNAIFGLEKSGHYYLPDFYWAETAVGMALLVWEMIDESGQTLEQLAAPLREKYFMSEQINKPVSDPDAIMARIKETYQKDFKVEEMDGVSVIADNWHANMRKSNTEPLLRLNVEAVGDKALMEKKRDELLSFMV
ncbi:MAG: hypothetical protein A3H70_05680 [Candidatus Komeilibacteria bacterium RIFCSPLOWO2_02_FULL_48_11]|uniref:Phosphomannomutase/phosphoglucomutase n=1 Tax=Candidatus Komeilibacteria bacterium RIFCSPLOWO2_02_FULL_48_11 TaxID=1798553 RepID=A0A1G2BXA0_9BACT|nr:MAG: hypothetical protein A3H70_05680 [Candidatus Komeilibacteria bacterium RIFCSPLOWO2_02_FULL_48_11]